MYISSVPTIRVVGWESCIVCMIYSRACLLGLPFAGSYLYYIDPARRPITAGEELLDDISVD